MEPSQSSAPFFQFAYEQEYPFCGDEVLPAELEPIVFGQFPRRLVKSVKASNYVCSLSLPEAEHIIFRPVQYGDGYHACESCFKRHVAQNNPPAAGADAASANKEASVPVHFRDKCREKEIASLEVECLAKDRGCPWSGVMSHFQKVHIRKCHHFVPGLLELKARVFHDKAKQTLEQTAAVVQQTGEDLKQLPALKTLNEQLSSKVEMLEAKVFSLTEQLNTPPASVNPSQRFDTNTLAGLREASAASRDRTVHSIEFSEVRTMSTCHPLHLFPLESEFFTVEDYQMRMILRPRDSNDSIHPSPVSGLYVQIVPGEKDHLLPWPCNISLKITVIGKRPSPEGHESSNLVRIIDLAKAPAHCRIRPEQGSDPAPVGIDCLETFENLFRSNLDNRDNSPLYVFDDKITMNVERFYGTAEVTAPMLHQIPYSALPFCWPIARFSEKIAAIRSGRTGRESLNSPSFFTADRGYLMALEFFPARDRLTSHLDRNRLLVNFLEGPCDDQLPWPPSGQLQLSILPPRDSTQKDKQFQVSLSDLSGKPSQGNANLELASVSDATLNLYIDQDMLALSVSYLHLPNLHDDTQ
ncbi:hypothetical protein [Endozoicomonas sp. YOMI1]|uniref:hypothetical protein n=1 Tax=Endozoicomonas sp. YOMI1 TaxID=2828739 RepID=UPI0021472F9F|nr:hypothetical protein [Endozoicomonas sp. YOMI1]